MSRETKAPQSILDQILDEMLIKLYDEDTLDNKTLENLRILANKNALTKVDKLLELLKEQGDAGEDP